jgi:aryl-alcohol dehydrogenase-like predicted oxidoreductase
MTESPFVLDVARVPRRRLGSTSVSVGAVGLGCMGLTGVYDVEHRDDRRATQAVQQALDVGIDYLDTADSFGPFGNERFLGQALAGRRDEVVLTTKVGITGRSDGTYHHNGTPEHIRAAVDESLRRLRTDVLDVYLLQAPDPEVDVAESWGAMAELVHAGKVRMLGIRTADTEILARLQRVYPISVVTAELSYAQQGNLPLARWTGSRGIAFVASSPLGRGLLTGSIAASRTFKWTDLRSKLPTFKP